MALPGDLDAERETFAAKLASATDLGANTRDKYLRNVGYFLVWLADAREPVGLVTVAELMGHADINTTRRYALPTEADKAAALEALTVDR